MNSLKTLHTFGFDSQAKSVTYLTEHEQLPQCAEKLTQQNAYLLGEGSNTVFVDDFDGNVIINQLKGIEHTQDEKHHYLKVSSGENWHQFVSWCLSQNMYGLENLALIPGTVGAAPIQNIGAYGVEVEKYIESVEYFDCQSLSFKHVSHKKAAFAYRDSVFKSGDLPPHIITCVNFCLPKQNQIVAHYSPLDSLSEASPQSIFELVVNTRQSKLPDPKILGNAGSFFKNPVISLSLYQDIKQRYPNIPSYPVDDEHVKLPAAWLIEQCGFKGQTVDGVQCYHKQALVLVNIDNGSGAALLHLASTIKATVKKIFKLELENEVRLVGKNGLVTI